MKVTSLSRSQAAAKCPAAPFWELHGITQAHVLHWTKTKSWQWVLIGAHLAAVGLRCSRTVVGRTQPRNRKASIYKESAKWNTSTGAKLGQNCYVTGKDSAATFWWLYNIGPVFQNAPFPQGIPWDSRAQIPRKGDLSELPGAAHDCRMGAVRGLILAMFFPCLISLRLPFYQMDIEPASEENSYFNHGNIYFSFFIYIHAVFPCLTTPSTTQVPQITQYHSEKRADTGVFRSHLISRPQAGPQCPQKQSMYHIPGFLWVSYSALQGQIYTQVFWGIHLHMIQGLFLH